MFIKQTAITVKEALDFIEKNKMHKWLEIEFLEFLKKFGFNKIEQKDQPVFPDRQFKLNTYFYPSTNFIAIKYSNIKLVALCNAFRPWEHTWSLPALYDLCAMLVEDKIPRIHPGYNLLTDFIQRIPDYISKSGSVSDTNYEGTKIHDFSKLKYEGTIENIFAGLCRDVCPTIIDYKNCILYYNPDGYGYEDEHTKSVLDKLNVNNVLFKLKLNLYSKHDKWDILNKSIKDGSVYIYPTKKCP